MRVLVTGSSGRIGSAICTRLSRDHAVVGLDILPSSTTDIVGSITDVNVIRQALQEVDAVVHTAALHAPHVGAIRESEFERVNVVCTRVLADEAVTAGAKRFVFTSTTALYGTASTIHQRAGWIDESVTPEPRTIYHHTKLAAEAALEVAAQSGTLAVTILRMSRCFPEPAPLMAAYRLHRGVDARDVADAHAIALQTISTGFRRYVVSGSTPFKPEDVQALARNAQSVLERRAPELVEAFKRRGWNLPNSIDRVYSPALLAQELGWSPRYGFDEVLKLLDAGSPEVLPPLNALPSNQSAMSAVNNACTAQ
ncbi:epimerase [Rubrivivax gelatinosus]|nr:epimerase [Rubrivivax gelatinosus]